jgi:protein ImuB
VNRRRYLALWFPFLPADRLHRSSDWHGQDETPLVLFETAANGLRLAAVDRRALALGLTPGLTLADARARVPELSTVEMDGKADAALLERLADVCDRYTPLVALDPPDGLILDITGCAHLFAGEETLRDDLMQRCHRAGIGVSASIAGTPDAARALARFGGAGIVPPGEESAAVRGLPVAALGIDPETVVALGRAGLKTVGDLMTRPRAPLTARFGADLPAKLERVTGSQDIGITPRRPLPACVVERHAAEPIADIDTILAILTGLASEAVRVLEGRGEGGRHFEAAFLRTDGMVRRIAVTTGRPLRDATALMRLLRERLDSLEDALDPGFGFDVIRLGVVASETLAPAQASLDGRLVEEEEVADLIDRLGARFGVQAVQRLALRDTHIPERSARTLPASIAQANGTDWGAPDPGMPPARPLYLFGRPQPIETLAEVPDGPPLRFRWRRVLHEIARAEGPERIAPEWWREADDSLTRDYYRVEDSAGRRFWVFREGQYGRDGLSPRWFIHGTFA